MARILILFAHPALEKSRVHSCLLRHTHSMDGITFHDLYEAYPDFDIDVEYEQQLLLQHDIIIFQHPFYWYSCPAILKQWQDLVLAHNWAYGHLGKKLLGKKLLNVISAGGSSEAYSKAGYNWFTIRELLAPFEQTARLCNMNYMPPFVVHGTHRLKKGDIELLAVQYEQLLIALVNDRVNEQEWSAAHYLNDLAPIAQSLQS